MNRKFNSKRYNHKFEESVVDKIRFNQILNLIGSGQKVLDVGCGDGFIMKKIKKAGNTVEGIEISSPAIKKARSRGFVVHDISLTSNWSKKISKKFDVVFAGEIIEHIFDTDKFLINISRVLKPKGKLVITTPNIASLGRRIMLFVGENPLLETTATPNDAGHIRYFTQKTLSNLLSKNHFKVQSNTSSVVNFDKEGKLFSVLLAKLFPQIGNNIIVKAIKNKK